MFYATVTGADAVLKTLRGLDREGRKVFKNAVRRDVRVGLREMQATARAGARKRTGRLRRAIKTKVKIVGLSVLGYLSIAWGKSRDDPAGAWYGPIINSGYTKGGRYHPGAHFMEKAYDRHAKSAARQLGLTITRAVDAASK